MKRRININAIISIIVCLIPFIISIVFYNRLPERVAVHFNINNQPDNYVPKLFAAFGVPTIILFLHLITMFLPEKSAKKANMPKALNYIYKWLIPVISIIVQIGIITFAVEGDAFNWNFYVFLFVGILLVVLGNYVPKIKQNVYFGFKIPTTLTNSDNWNKTHRISGFLMVAGGFILIVNAFLNQWWLIIAVIIVIVVIPAVYSYGIYKNSESKSE